ncbi:vWA domain-containing protein [Magnetospira sp. QH-2]|uniref:vWA domain-containing protein n=1 Tax=Magnetospira sp. (strain QH-2) TaxID=1288970 RepID=UPI0011DDFF36|nr:vWA domain-containing protein [Magnetospira sp. QH-2]
MCWYDAAVRWGEDRAAIAARLLVTGANVAAGIILPDDPVKQEVYGDATTCSSFEHIPPILPVLPELEGGEEEVNERRPLLIPGKETLYQRVLARKTLQLRDSPSVATAPRSKAIPPLTILYLFAEKEVDNEFWFEVGFDLKGTNSGWVAARDLTFWNQSIVMTFAPRSERNQVLFFGDREEALLNNVQAAKQDYKQLHKGYCAGDPTTTDMIVAVEPRGYADPSQGFYFFPILRSETIRMRNGQRGKLMQVAAISQSIPGGAQAKAMDTDRCGRGADVNPDRRPSLVGAAQPHFGLVFVIDTTVSMQPYIDGVRRVLENTMTRIRQDVQDARISIAVVGYRDSLEATPGLEYLTKVHSDFVPSHRQNELVKVFRTMTEARVSSRNYREDAMSGIERALDNGRGLDWSDKDAGIIVLITDASAREAGDPLSGSGKNPDELAVQAKETNRHIVTIHLRTPGGQTNNDWERAMAQYRQLATTLEQEVAVSYIPVEGGDLERYDNVIETALNTIMADLQGRQSGEPTDQVDQPTQKIVSRLARAMRLAYQGRVEGASPPEVFQAWVADRDPITPSLQAFEIRVLLSKNQLSDLHQALKAILEAADQGKLTSKGFFNRLRSTTAVMTRDPKKIARLGDVGRIDELLEGLPYRSSILNITEDIWLGWGAERKQSFINSLTSKILAYRKYHDNADLWTSFEGQDGSGEAYYAIPLKLMP